MRSDRLSRAQQVVLDALRDQPDLVEIEALGRRVGRHPNTLRDHLAVLVGLGLVERQQAPTQGRGRPRWLYAATGPAEVDENAELAAALAWRLAHKEKDPLAATREVSRHWAGEIVVRMELEPQRTPKTGRAQVVAVLDELGYAPRPDTRIDRVSLTRCPLLRAASTVPEIVCNVHRGLIAELLGVSGADPERVTLQPFAQPGACALRLLAPVSTAAAPSR